MPSMRTQALAISAAANSETTAALIANLARQMPKRRRYRSPATYLLCWLLGSFLYAFAVINSLLDIRFDLAMRLKDPVFLSMVGFMLVGAIAFAYSALTSSIPASKDRFSYFGAGATITWVGLLIYGMVCDIPALLNGQAFFHFNTQVFAVLLLAGSLPLVALWLITQHLAPLKSGKVAIAMSIASFMLAATVLRFYYVSLYNGVDCSFNLFFWLLIPLLVSSGCGAVSVKPFMRRWLPGLRLNN